MIQQNFNADWKFYKEGEETKKITLPHDAMLEEKRIPDLIAGENSAYFPPGGNMPMKKILIYQRKRNAYSYISTGFIRRQKLN